MLDQQLKERELARLEAERQTELDQQAVEEIVRRINDEDMEDMRRKRLLQEATARMVRDYEEQRKREVQARIARERAEEERILAYNRDVEARQAGIKERKAQKKEEDDRIFRQIAAEAQRKQAEEAEFSYLRDMLWDEELESKREAEARERREHQERMKHEMMAANSEMLASKERLRRLEAEEEARVVAVMRRKFAEDEAREREEAEQRRLLKLRHIALIEEQRRLRRDREVEERVAELRRLEEESQCEEYRRRVVEEARRRLLQEHAAKVRDYIHGGVFRSREEYDDFVRMAEEKLSS